MTMSLFETLSSQDIFIERRDFLSPLSFIEVITSPLLCKEEIATSTFTASIDPFFGAPVCFILYQTFKRLWIK